MIPPAVPTSAVRRGDITPRAVSTSAVRRGDITSRAVSTSAVRRGDITSRAVSTSAARGGDMAPRAVSTSAARRGDITPHVSAAEPSLPGSSTRAVRNSTAVRHCAGSFLDWIPMMFLILPLTVAGDRKRGSVPPTATDSHRQPPTATDSHRQPPADRSGFIGAVPCGAETDAEVLVRGGESARGGLDGAGPGGGADRHRRVWCRQRTILHGTRDTPRHFTVRSGPLVS
jgi:hypothetical protein